MANRLLLLVGLERTYQPWWTNHVRSSFKKTVARHRLNQNRSAKTSFLIIDAQSVRNIDPAEHKGYDGGKKLASIKRHIGVDINGLPMAVHITTANVSERDGG